MKMSKSRGNTIDPLALIEGYGADALRLAIARGVNPGADMALSEQWVAGSHDFGTKLWNAARFVLAHGADPDGEINPALLTDADRWILDRIAAVNAEVDALLEGFQFAKATELLYHFTWDEFCDWYLELAKVQLGENPDRRRTPDGARHRARRAAAAAAPGDAVHHRVAVDRVDRRRVTGGGVLAPAESAS
ncbi:MAG: valyl-tRNA synthetase [Pseudonocardiales bacterium]|jgi:valyl-tRNA synthetase|nr:valyl-tRNA synthetase [Pseudonocardiales bacterium]